MFWHKVKGQRSLWPCKTHFFWSNGYVIILMSFYFLLNPVKQNLVVLDTMTNYQSIQRDKMMKWRRYTSERSNHYVLQNTDVMKSLIPALALPPLSLCMSRLSFLSLSVPSFIRSGTRLPSQRCPPQVVVGTNDQVPSQLKEVRKYKSRKITRWHSLCDLMVRVSPHD